MSLISPYLAFISKATTVHSINLPLLYQPNGWTIYRWFHAWLLVAVLIARYVSMRTQQREVGWHLGRCQQLAHICLSLIVAASSNIIVSFLFPAYVSTDGHPLVVLFLKSPSPIDVEIGSHITLMLVGLHMVLDDRQASTFFNIVDSRISCVSVIFMTPPTQKNVDLTWKIHKIGYFSW